MKKWNGAWKGWILEDVLMLFRHLTKAQEPADKESFEELPWRMEMDPDGHFTVYTRQIIPAELFRCFDAIFFLRYGVDPKSWTPVVRIPENSLEWDKADLLPEHQRGVLLDREADAGWRCAESLLIMDGALTASSDAGADEEEAPLRLQAVRLVTPPQDTGPKEEPAFLRKVMH